MPSQPATPKPTPIDADAVTQYIAETFAKVETRDAIGYRYFFYEGDHTIPFATIVNEDVEYYLTENLGHPEVFRLEIGVGEEMYRTLFGEPPASKK